MKQTSQVPQNDARAPQVVIRTERFVLRPIQSSDLGQITQHASDERVARSTTSIPHPMPPGASDALLERAHNPARTEDIWAIVVPSERGDDLMGLISLERLDREQSEIGYWVVPALWNSGIASEALQALFAANPQASKTIFAEVFQDNPASARVLTNQGFEYLGDAEAFSVARDAAVATWTYSKKCT
ncbi:GNAT family N-acetyltransferase [Algirhabdus cladophorae]|uniref:GNAT family N-acetyltransferase n=1 Tax=Algirhabdus cladophorae TaxID=3377108 RepID=UPI003B845B53